MPKLTKPPSRLKCRHGHFNCLLCYNLYFPTTKIGEEKYYKLILEQPLTHKETVYLKSKIMANLASGEGNHESAEVTPTNPLPKLEGGEQ